MRLYELVPNPDVLVALEPEEVGGLLLVHMNSLGPRDQNMNRHNFFRRPEDTFYEYARERHEQIVMAFAEAWAGLDRQASIIPNPQQGNVWFPVSRRGSQIRTSVDFAAYRHASLLLREQLQSSIADRVSATFLRGSYDTAVFESFKTGGGSRP